MSELKIQNALKKITNILSNVYIEQSYSEALLLLSLATQKDISWLIAHKEYVLTSTQEKALDLFVRRRELREPYSYISGKREFLGMEFLTGRGVLIPRPETEMLVEIITGLLKNMTEYKKIYALDIGTGTGCIAIGLAAFCTGIDVTACDSSEEALIYANSNISMLSGFFKNGSSVKAIKADIEDDLFCNNFDRRFDLLVSNPPYIKSEDILKLEPEIAYEPLMALDGHADGLHFYKVIANKAEFLLEDKGRMVFETGCDQMEEVCNIINSNNILVVDEVKKDYSGKWRYIIAAKL